MALFPGGYIHVGGDEAVKDQWKASPKIQAQMKKLGITGEDALQSYFVARIGKFLASHGRKLIGWDEILEGGVPPDATITSWRGVDGGIAAAKLGHDAVMSPAPVLYFDNRNGDGVSEPPGRGHITSLEDVYDFDPAPAVLSDSQRAHIIGVQGNIWTEHIRLEQWIDHMAFPRAAALAEIAWSPAGLHDWQGFLTRLAPEMDRYRALGIDAASSGFEPAVTAKIREDNKHVDVMLTNQTSFGDIRYTLDGSDPMPSSRGANPFAAEMPARLLTSTFFHGHALASRERLATPLDPFSLHLRRSQQLKLCTDKLPLNLEGDTPLNGPRPVFLVDVMNPCWIYPGADMDGVAVIGVDVGHVPFNFQLGQDAKNIPLKVPETPDGELEVHLDSCDGPRILDRPLGFAASRDGVTQLVDRIAPVSGLHDLCFVFARSKLDPMWVIASVTLSPPDAQPTNGPAE
jgi:hexosaminidase